MGDMNPGTKYDEALMSILTNEKSIFGFLSTVFNFLARRTDFYYVPEGPYENMGFPPGVAEELVVKVLRKCDPKNWKPPNGTNRQTDINNEIMCSTVAQEVEVIAEEDQEIMEELASEVQNVEIESSPPFEEPNAKSKSLEVVPPKPDMKAGDAPPIIPSQKNSEAYNGAERDMYCWSQTIMELDITVKLPLDVKSSKDIKVIINSGDISITRRNGEVILKDKLPYKIKSIESFWTISEGKLLIHLEKIQERWWNKLLESEEEIDLDKIDCSRSLYELPEDHVAKVREMQWNQEQKMKGLPTTDQIRNIEILKKAWDAEGSPFKGQKFDPNVLNMQQ